MLVVQPEHGVNAASGSLKAVKGFSNGVSCWHGGLFSSGSPLLAPPANRDRQGHQIPHESHPSDSNQCSSHYQTFHSAPHPILAIFLHVFLVDHLSGDKVSNASFGL